MTFDGLPLTEILEPRAESELSAMIADACAAETAIYPLGGRTSLDYGATAARPGAGLSLLGLNRVIDYPARDMTITVGAGVTLAELARILAAERQWLPVLAPRADEATIGGLVATAWSDGRRYGWGTMRDYVIGVRAVDGRGMPFKGGGRVVKNVAGYDFCKLLTGSLGSLGVITEVTLRLKPAPERSALLALPVDDLDDAEQALVRLTTTATRPAAIELLVGPGWKNLLAVETAAPAELGYVVVVLDGSADEVAWMISTLEAEFGEPRQAGCLPGDATSTPQPPRSRAPWTTIDDRRSAALDARMRDFSAAPAALTLKAAVTPSRVCETIRLLRQEDPAVELLAHAGNGIVYASFADALRAASLSGVASAPDASSDGQQLIGALGRLRAAISGNVTVVSCSLPFRLDPELVWGPTLPAHRWMRRVRDQFDPGGVLNPGRVVAGRW